MVSRPIYNAAVMSETKSAPLPSEEAIAIVGVGLIGGSIAAALKQRGFAGSIIGVGRSAARLEGAQSAGLIDVALTDLAEAARTATLFVFCTPVDRIVDGVREAAAGCRPGTLLTDAGSVKKSICDAFRPQSGSSPLGEDVCFIGSHPLAGSEKQGYEHAKADLFEGRVVVVTPTAETAPASTARLKQFWESLGSTVVTMSADEHDHALAQTSHLPHVVAAALSGTLSDLPEDLCSTGALDTTRIAAGDPDLWSAILLANSEEIAAGMDRFSRRFSEIRDAIANRDAEALKNLLHVAKTNRDRLSHH